MLARAIALCIVFVAAAASSGCKDALNDFDEFARRSTRDLSADPDAPPGMVYDISGEFLMAVATNVDPDRPILLIAASVMAPAGNGTAVLDLTLTPLTVKDHQPLVGMELIATGIEVSADGRFVADFGKQTFPSSANPLFSSDIVADLRLVARITSPDAYCGDVEGQVSRPLQLDLAGSRFGARRIAAGTVGAALPPASITCEGVMVDGGG